MEASLAENGEARGYERVVVTGGVTTAAAAARVTATARRPAAAGPPPAPLSTPPPPPPHPSPHLHHSLLHVLTQLIILRVGVCDRGRGGHETLPMQMITK